MANHHRIYQYTSIGRPLDPSFPTNKAVLFLLPLAAVIGAGLALAGGMGPVDALWKGMVVLLAAFIGWALGRELDPDHNPTAFVGMALAFAASLFANPGLLLAITTLGLVRLVNRSTGLKARKSDSIIVMLLVFAVIYTTQSPLFGIAAAVAFILDGSLGQALRHQWVFGLICLGGSLVYLVDHGMGSASISVPNSLLEWVSLLFLLIFVFNTMLLKRVASLGDVAAKPLDPSRVRGGMAVALLAALQGIDRPETIIILISSIAGVCIGMAFGKGFKAPVSG
jgi:hypothetical protein